MSDEERAGKLRDIDFKVGTYGLQNADNKMHKDMATMRIEGLLRHLKVDPKEISETAEMIIRSAENGRHGPEEKQKDIVRIFVAPLLRGQTPELIDKAISAIHGTAQGHVKEKFKFEIKADGPESTKPSARPVKPKNPGF